MFLIDIVIIFNAAYEDEDFNMIDDRKVIATTYIKSWFFIDIFAIVPFHLIFGSADFSDIVRITKIGKMYKLVKLTRLLRVLKIVKEKSKIAKYLQNVFKIGVGMQRLATFMLITIIIIHIVACLWIMTGANIGDPNMPSGEKYLTSIYFTVQTITTVGYGDFSIESISDKIFCTLTMLIGVIAFSFASGSLATILLEYDN